MEKHHHFPYPITSSDKAKIDATELACIKAAKETVDFANEYKKIHGVFPKFA